MKKILLCTLGVMIALISNSKTYVVTSPDKSIEMRIDVGSDMRYSVWMDGSEVLRPSAISLRLADGRVLGHDTKVKKVTREHANEQVPALAYRKASVRNSYNQLTLHTADFQLQMRAYNEGVAYRWIMQSTRDLIVENEQADFIFASDDLHAIYNYSNGTGDLQGQFSNSFENIYHNQPIRHITRDSLILIPAMVALPNGGKAVVTEVNQYGYPGLFLHHGEQGFESLFAPYPKAVQQGGHNNLEMLVSEREDYIARISGKAVLPWRMMALAREDKQMLDNDLVFCLAEPCRLSDTSWIRPGKVAWDWWNDWNLEGVDFYAGINNDTYKYYIDFASRYGIEYVILDEGWAVNGKADMMQVVPEIDLRMLIDYAASRQVGIILWGGYWAMDRDLENICRHYSEMGVKGFKVDFMNRDDQPMVEFYQRMAETAAKYHLLVDFHGGFKPSGMNRTYPNVVNYEAVYGLEQLKWEKEVDMVLHDVTLPFVRQVAGPMDYTQGAMHNVKKYNYRPCYSEPMSQGTRCHQLAEYIVFESPLNMLCDAPTSYEKEPEYTRFVASIPTVWDETHVLMGEVQQYVVVARRKGKDWYVAGINNWSTRTLDISLGELFTDGAQGTTATPRMTISDIFTDGINAARKGTDYQHQTQVQPSATGSITVTMQPGGGFLIKLTTK